MRGPLSPAERPNGGTAVKPETWIAIYAAIVGTSAFLLNLKSWFDSGVKLHLNLAPYAMTIGGDPAFEERDLVILSVTNRGDAPTRVTNMVLFEITSWWQLWRVRPKTSYVIPNPQLKGYPLNVPSTLEPSEKWTGAIRQRVDMIPDLYTGNYYAGIYASNRDRPYLIRIPKRRNKLPAGTTALEGSR
jgi:hypothetical protein